MVAPLLVGGPRRYLVTAAYGIAAVIASTLWLVVPFALWKSYGIGWTLFWLLPTTVAIFALIQRREEADEVPASFNWSESSEEELEDDVELPEGYHDWLAEIMQPPPKWYRAGQWATIAAFLAIFLCGMVEQWFLWMVVLAQLIDPWAIVFGAFIVISQLLMLMRERVRQPIRSV